jgi:hypothetical protein
MGILDFWKGKAITADNVEAKARDVGVEVSEKETTIAKMRAELSTQVLGGDHLGAHRIRHEEDELAALRLTKTELEASARELRVIEAEAELEAQHKIAVERGLQVEQAGSELAKVIASVRPAFANYMALSRNMDDPTAYQHAIAAAQAVGRATANDSLVQGLVNLKQLWNSASAGDPKAFEKFGGETLSGLVPFSSLLKAGARAQDPTMRNPQTVGQSIETGIPGMQSNVPARYDIYGKPVLGMPGVPNNLLYPVNVTTATKPDKVDQAIIDTQADFMRVPSYISGRAQRGLDDPNNPDVGVPLDPAEQETWARLRGDGLKDQLNNVVSSPAFDSSSPLMKKQRLEYVGAKYSEMATMRLLQADKSLMAKYIARQTAKQMALMPPAAPTGAPGPGPEASAGAP